MRIAINFTKVRKADKLQPIYSPRTQYKRIREYEEKLLSDLTLNFDRFAITLLKKQFEKRGWKMNIVQFISVVKENLISWQSDLPNRDLRIMRCLMNLFNQIDLNCNKILEWDQFTNYVIQKATVLKHLKSKTEQIKAYTKSSVKPKQKIDAIIPKTVYISHINRLALFEQGSNIIRFMNPDTGDFNQKNLTINLKQLSVNISSLKKDRKDKRFYMKNKQLIVQTEIRVLDMLYISEPKYQILITSTSDCIVRGWKYTPSGFILATQPDNDEEVLEHQFQQQIYCLAWDQLNELLYCGQKDGSISIWNLKSDTQRFLYYTEDKQQIIGHNMLIMDMVTMPKLQFMASAGMDGKLILWDTINNKIKWVYKQHTRGILTLSFNQSLILLFSAGFDHVICIWNPYISSLIHKIEGHVAPILSVKVIQGSHQVVSLDSEGIVKISDTRRFNFISSFSLQSNQETRISPTSMTIIPKPLKICFAGKSISIFQYDKNYNPNSVDDSYAICCKYLAESLSFLTPAGNKVKLWNALTGDIDKIYLQVTNHEISAFCLDHYQRRMVIGDIKGNVNLYNSKNGAKIKSLPHHLGQIIYLTSHNIEGIDIFISAAVDNQIHISKQMQDSYELIKTIQIKKQFNITALTFCKNTSLIIVGLNNGSVGFYEIQTGKLIANINQNNNSQITCLCIVDQIALMSTTVNGNIILNYMPPNVQKFQKIFSQNHIDPQNKNISLGILLGTCDSKNKMFYVIDEKCYMSCYSFGQSINNTTTLNFLKQKSLKKSLSHKSSLLSKNLNLLWSVKTHNQLVRSLQFIDSEAILITSSYDKKVIIWDAITGNQIDSFQQNYDKRQPKPIAFRKKSTNEIFSPDLKESVNKLKLKSYNSEQEEQFQQPSRCHLFNPFYQFSQIEINKLPDVISNYDWKLEINYKHHYEQQTKQFQKLIAQIQKYDKNSNNKKYNWNQDTYRYKKTEIQQQTKSKIKILLKNAKASTITNLGDFMSSRQKQPKLSQNIFPYDPQSKYQKTKRLIFNKKQKKILQMFNLKKIKSKQDLRKQKQQHENYITSLSKKQLTGRLVAQCDNKIYLSTQQAVAAQKLGHALYDIDQDNRRLINFTNNIVIRQKKIPKITMR